MTLLSAGTVAMALAAAGPPVAAADSTVRVNTTLDEAQPGNGTCSLREATLYANGTPEPDCAPTTASGTTTIDVPTGVYVLTGGPLSLTGNAAIAGAGAGTTTITGGGMSQVVVVAAGVRASISDVAITGGLSGQVCIEMCGLGLGLDGVPGGGIANAGTLALTRVIVTGNRTSAGATSSNCTNNNPGGCEGGDGGGGGGISNTGTLTIASSTITGNTTGDGASGTPGKAGNGGGISGSGGSGGAISNLGTLTIIGSTISGNTTGRGATGARGGDTPGGTDGGQGSDGGFGGAGGAIESTGPLVISTSTIAANRTGAGGDGGAGGNGSGTGRGGTGGLGGPGGSGGAIDSNTNMTISNSTITGNAAASSGAPGGGGIPQGLTPGPTKPGNGGGIEQSGMGTTLTHVTIASNSAPGLGGGIAGDGGTVTAANSIVASNAGASPNQNCTGVVTDQGGNVEFGGNSCPAGFLRADPRLAPLANNGGPTETIALQPGSAAIHHVRTCVFGSDQRGAARPVGSACDSGAYQVAPPSPSGISAGGITTTTAAITGAVNPNLQDATVVVNYGLTPSYGSSTSPQDLGAGNAPAPFTSALTGLQPNKTYHFDVVATNRDGQTTSADGAFITLPPLTASIARASTTGPALSLTIACGGGSGPGTCAGTIGLTSRVAAKHRRAVKVAAGSYSVHSGSRVTVRVGLNQAGRRLLTEHYSLSSTLSLRGTSHVTRGVTFRYPRIKAGIPFTASFSGSSTVFSELTVTGVPRGGKVTVTCRGGGCPFGERAFAPRHRQVVLASTFQHAPLRPGASLRIEVSAANRVANVETFAIRGGQQPIVLHQCLPPGASRPAKCVSGR
ncbi:MAG TPA: CSLREA domain-containing protein [Solirubrobacteraceae bacterium]|nr:CSLREA domain-containing protein [Solirubrobacteraceae bacterium]